MHPLGDYLLSCSTDEHWAFSDIRTGKMLIKVSSAASAPSTDGEASAGGTPVALTCAKFHPDGLIFGTGTADSVIKVSCSFYFFKYRIDFKLNKKFTP